MRAHANVKTHRSPSSLSDTQPHTVPPLKKVLPPADRPFPAAASCLPPTSEVKQTTGRKGVLSCPCHAKQRRRAGGPGPAQSQSQPPAVQPSHQRYVSPRDPNGGTPQGGYHSFIVWRARSSGARPSIHPLATAHCPLGAPKKEKSPASQPLNHHQQRKKRHSEPRSRIGGRAPPPRLCTPYSFPPSVGSSGGSRTGTAALATTIINEKHYVTQCVYDLVDAKPG